jgi:hypothetical protein
MFRGYFLDWIAPAILLTLLAISCLLSFRLFAVELARR